MCVFKFFSETTGPTEAKLHVGGFIQMILVIFVLNFNIVSLQAAWAFSEDLARQCRAFSRALKIEKLKAPLFPGPKRAGDTNDWCITDLPPYVAAIFTVSWTL